MVHLPASKDSTNVGSLEKESRKLTIDATGTPASPASPGKKALEKPQKVLPCPRCESMNTKFCYYNNYSVNQPRHFCRQCQRYWTVGGTLRNVPVGGGSRKKNRHQRQEPYLRTGPGSIGSPLAMATSGGQPGMPNMGFQQLLTHDMSGFNFSQLPGFVPQNHYSTYSVDQTQGMYVQPLSSKTAQQEFQSMHPMYAAMNPQSMPPVTGNYYGPDLGTQLQGDNVVSTTGAVGSVKPEFWSNMMPQNPHPQGSNHPVSAMWEQSSPTSTTPTGAAEQGAGKTGVPATLQTISKSGGYDSSMLLHLGLNSRPQLGGKPAAWNQNQLDSRGGTHPTNGSSPPHGSSTIEEEGSTPTNGYSNSGYEEGDTVSSMWQDMHDMHDIFQ